MSYDPNRLMGLDALSPTIGAYKQFVEQRGNQNNPNIIHPELEGLIALKTRIDNAAKAQQALAQQPQSAPPTVADEYRMAAQQQAQQEMMARMQQARMAQAAPGLAGMPNPVMQQANFAGGGMVAFDEGGWVKHYDGLSGSTVGDGDAMGRNAAYKMQTGQQLTPEELTAYNNYRESYALNLVGGAVPEPLTSEETALLRRYASPLSKFGMGYVIPEDKEKYEAARQKYLKLQKYKEAGGGAKAGAPPAAIPAASTAAPASTTQAIPSDTPTLADLKNKYAVKPPAPTGGIGSLVKPPVTTTTKDTAPAAPPATAAATPAFTNPYKELAEQVVKPESEYIKEAMERSKELGAGGAAAEFKKVISKLKDRYEGEGADKENLKEAIVQFGAAWMSGANFGEATKAGVGKYYTGKKENEKAAMDLAKSTFELEQAEENLRLSAAKEGSAEFKAKEKEVRDAKLKQADAVLDLEKIRQQAQNRIAELDKQAKANMALSKFEQGEQNKRTELMYGDKTNTTRLNDIATRALAVLNSNWASMNPNAPEVVQAKQDYQYAIDALKGQAGAGGTVSPEVQALLNKYK